MPTPPIPQPLRAAAGLAAVAIDSARKLPEQLVGFPVLAVSTALQASLKAQQRYAELVVRGDQLLGQLRGQSDGTPPWARFDDDVPDGRPRSAFDLAADPDGDDLLGGGLGGEDELAAMAEAADALADAEALVEAVAAADALADAEALVEAVAAADALADAEALVEVDEPPPAEALAADGYLATEPPISGYDALSFAQLRGRLRSLSVDQLEALISYERHSQARAPFLTMLENRIATLRSR